MKLKRRFDWSDRTTIYKQVNENEVERATGGMIRFSVVDINAHTYEGAAFETTVYEMTKFAFWKLIANPKKPDKSIIVEAQPNFGKSEPACESTSAPESEIGTKPKTKRS